MSAERKRDQEFREPRDPQVMEIPPLTLGDFLRHPGDYFIGFIVSAILVGSTWVERQLDRPPKI